jgi:3-hydroxybutyryl-CoA dehydratase
LSRVTATQPPSAVKPGDSFSETRNFDARSIAEFVERTGDRNPVHTDPEAGASSRFGKRIASGQHVVSLMLGLAATWMAQRGTSFGLGCSFRFTAAVREGDDVTLRWTVTDAAYKESLRGMIVVLEGTAINAAGLVCCRGRLEMLLQS